VLELATKPKNTYGIIIENNKLNLPTSQITKRALTPQFTDGVGWRFLCSAQNVTAHGVPQDCLVKF